MSQIIEGPEKILENIKIQLLEGVKNHYHGFHTPVFSNFKNSQLISSRIVVLRKFNASSMKISFHSDIRSKKIEEIKERTDSIFLFYDKKIKIQLRIITKSKIHYNDYVTQQAWDLCKLSSRKCYLAKIPPGTNTEIATDGLIEELKRRDPTKKESEKGYINFAVISNQIKSIEWLYLSSFGHRRLLIKIENARNTYSWLIP